MSQIAQLVDRDQDVCLRVLEEPGREVGLASRLLSGRSQLAGEHGQRQLGAVVEVVLQPATLIIRHRHQTRPRLAQTPSRSRSATTAARNIVDSAATETYSCVLSVLRGINSTTNGPE